MAPGSRIRIGTSGWHYDHWKGTFYPPDMRAEEMLGYYCERFETVEINNSFYRLPEPETFRQWSDTAPAAFLFSVKASRYITHLKKLKDPDEPVERLLERASGLGEALGPFLFQLPPRWKCNLDRLRSFLEVLPTGKRCAFEFRDPDWFRDTVYEALSEKNAAFCIYELAGRESPRQVTADFVYVRLHGPGDAYEGCYDKQTLAGWAGAFSAWAGQGKEVYCYFDNDQEGYAAENALTLKEMLQS